MAKNCRKRPEFVENSPKTSQNGRKNKAFFVAIRKKIVKIVKKDPKPQNIVINQPEWQKTAKNTKLLLKLNFPFPTH